MKLYGKIKEVIPKLLELDNQKEYLVEIKEPTKKRSLEQNKKLWKLTHFIAKETYHDDMEIYCSLLEQADAKSDYVITATDMEDSLRKSFRGVKFIRKQIVNNKECNVYKVFLGSSKMTTKEMSELIEQAIKTCYDLGIKIDEDLYE